MKKKLSRIIDTNRQHIFSLIVFCFFYNSAMPQGNLYFEKITDPGFYTTITRCAVFDKHNIMYVGTNDGLYRYNGSAFSKFPSAAAGDRTCPVNNIRTLGFDGTHVWIGGREGIAVLDPETNRFVQMRLPDSNTENTTVRSMHIANNKVYAASEKGVAIFETSNLQLVKYISMPDAFMRETNSIIRVVHADADGQLYIGTTSGLFLYNADVVNSAVEISDAFTPLANSDITEIYFLDANRILIAADNLIYLYDKKQNQLNPFINYESEGTDIQAPIKDIVQLSTDGDLFIATYGEGLFYYTTADKKMHQYIFDESWYNSIPENYINAVADGGNGIFWMITENAGLVKVDMWYSRFKYHLVPSGAFLPSVHDVEVINKKIWLATSNGLYALNAEGFYTQYTPDSYNDFYFQNLQSIGTDYLVFQIWSEGVGVYDLQNEKFGFLNIPGSDIVSTAPLFDWLSFADSEGNFYLADYDGNYLRCNYNTNTTDTLFTARQVNLHLPLVIPQSAEIIWIADASALYRYDMQTKILQLIQVDAKGNKLPPVAFQEDIIVRPDGTIYIASDEGFFRYSFDQNILKHFTVNDGLPSNNCFSLFENPEGKIFISFNNGIVQYNESNEDFTVYPMPALMASSPTPFFDEENNFYLGADKAFITVPFNALTAYPGKPQLRILSITAGKKIFDINNFQNGIHLRQNDFPLVIEYEMIDYAGAGYNILRYQLNGWDADWILDNNRNMRVIYSKLTAGEYTFQLQVRSPLNNETTFIELPVVVAAPFWLTWWFISGVIVLLLAIPFSIYRYRINALKKIQALRNKIALDLHDEVGSSISSIRMLSDMANTQLAGNPILQKISDNAKETMDKMGDIVWMINPKYDDIQNLIKRMERHLNMLCSNSELQYTFDNNLPVDIKLNMQQRKNILLVFKEAVNNTLKYSQAKKLSVTLYHNQKQFSMQIRDDGVGFDKVNIQRGNGLDSMVFRAKEMNGLLTIESEINMGTVIHLQFPC